MTLIGFHWLKKERKTVQLCLVPLERVGSVGVSTEQSCFNKVQSDEWIKGLEM